MKKIFYSLLILITIICPFYVNAEESVLNENEMIVTLEKCIDGDTATFKDSTGNTYKTRFLAIDTPETVHPTKSVEAYGKDASTYTCETLTNAKVIKLETDPASDKEDKYGRLLAWVFVDDVLLQDNLIKNGLAKVSYLYGDYKYTETLQATEEIAKNEKLGIWSSENNKTETDQVKDKDTKVEKTEKGFIEIIVDTLFGMVIDYIEELLDNIASYIENMI